MEHPEGIEPSNLYGGGLKPPAFDRSAKGAYHRERICVYNVSDMSAAYKHGLQWPFMTDLYYRYNASTRALQDRSQHYAGQQFDSGSTRMHFTYDPINYLELQDYRAYIIFDIQGPDGNPMVYGPSSTPRFDGFTFDIPWDVTSRVKSARIQFQLWLIRSNITINDYTDIPKLESTDYELSSLAGIALKNSARCKRPCDPCGPMNPSTEPNLVGMMDLYNTYGVILPIRSQVNEETNRLELIFRTYYGEKDQTITLNVPLLDEDGTVSTEFLPIIQSWFDPSGNFLPTQQNLASAALIYAALSEKSDKFQPVVPWDASVNYPAGALVLDSKHDVYRATAPSLGVEPKEGIDAWVRLLDTSDIPDPPEPGSGEEPSDDAILDYRYIKTLLAEKFDVSNVINEWSEPPSTEKVPSEALVRTIIQETQDEAKSQVIDSWSESAATDKAPSERLVREALDTKTDKTMAIPEWDDTTVYGQQSTVVYEGIVYISTINNNTGKVPSLEDMYWTPLASQGTGGGAGASSRDTFVAYIGDGVSTTIDVEHDLGSENVFVELRLADERRQVRTTTVVLDEDTVRVSFKHAPPVNGIVILIGKVESSPDAIVTVVGDGINNTFTIEHDWGTYNIFSQFRDVQSGELVFADVTYVDPSHVQIGFSLPPDPDSIVFYMAPCIPSASIDRCTYTQRVPSDVWVINHGLNRIVAVYTMTLDGEEMNGWVKQDITTLDSVTIRFSEPVTGIAYLR